MWGTLRTGVYYQPLPPVEWLMFGPLIFNFLLTCSWTLLATLVTPRASALSLRLLHLLTTRSALQCLRYMQQLVYLTTVRWDVCYSSSCHVHIRPPSGTAIHWWHGLQYGGQPGRCTFNCHMSCLVYCTTTKWFRGTVFWEKCVCPHPSAEKRNRNSQNLA